MAIKPGQGLAKWEIATLRKIVGLHGLASARFDHDDYEDLLQECLAHWISVRGRLPPGPDIPPPTAYMAQVIRNKLTDIVRERASDKRAGAPGALSFEEPLDGDEEGGFTVADCISEADLANSSVRRGAEREAHDLRADLARAMAGLKPEDRELCRLLGEEGLSVTEVSQVLKVPRSTVYEQIKRIRDRLHRLGFHGYLRG